MRNFVVLCAVAAALAFTASDAHAKKCCAKTKSCGNRCGQVSTCCAQTAPAPCQVASCNNGCNTGCRTASCGKTKNHGCCNARPTCAVNTCCATGTAPVVAKPYEEVKAPEVAPAPAPAPTPAAK